MSIYHLHLQKGLTYNEHSISIYYTAYEIEGGKSILEKRFNTTRDNIILLFKLVLTKIVQGHQGGLVG